jgi:Sulfotransferase domain
MKRPIYFANFVKAIKGVITGKSIAPMTSFYDARYPPTKFLRYHQSKIHIQCIMCGFPRTGTHWIRNVIEKSTGKKTFNLYANKPSPSDKDVLLIKVHARNKFIARVKTLWLLPPFDFGSKYIYVYRDPRDSIISMYEMYKKAKEFVDLDTEEFLDINDPISQYRWEINAWVFQKHEDVLLVKFEDLKMFPSEGFRRIFRFLGLNSTIADESIRQMVCALDTKKRPRGTAYGWKKAPVEYQSIIDAVVNKLDKEIRLLGYDEI